jgi:hypothetical protein
LATCPSKHPLLLPFFAMVTTWVRRPSSRFALICSKPPLKPRQDFCGHRLFPNPRHEAQDLFFKSLLDPSFSPRCAQYGETSLSEGKLHSLSSTHHHLECQTHTHLHIHHRGRALRVGWIKNEEVVGLRTYKGMSDLHLIIIPSSHPLTLLQTSVPCRARHWHYPLLPVLI